MPRRAFSWRNLLGSGGNPAGNRRRALVFVAVSAVAIVLGLAIANEYFRRHRTVFAAGGGDRPVQLSVDGEPSIPVGALAKLQLAEGRHRVKLSGTMNDEFNLDLETGYFTRWTNNPVWVLNVDGGAAVEVRTVHYAAVNPRHSDSQLVLGQRLFYFPHVDYPFETPPPKIEVEQGTGETNKICLARVNGPASILFPYAVQNCGVEPALAFAEARLRGDRNDTLLLYAYAEGAAAAGLLDRARQFLQAGLWQQPLSIAWHRAFQDLDRSPERHKSLAAEYDRSLTKEPNNAGLLYLRGRIEDDRARRRSSSAARVRPTPRWPGRKWPWPMTRPVRATGKRAGSSPSGRPS